MGKLYLCIADERQRRAVSKRRDVVQSPRHACQLIVKAASYEFPWDDEVMDAAFEILRSAVPKKDALIDKIENLAGSMSNMAYELEHGHLDYEEAEDAEDDHARDMKKLQKMLASLGVS